MMINELKFIEDTVREYLDNAVIIDDEMNLLSLNELYEENETNEVLGEGNDIELNEDDINFGLDTSSKETLDHAQLSCRPNEVYQSFKTNGIVTMPFCFFPRKEDEQITQLTNVLSNAKILIVDWNLEGVPGGSSTLIGGATKKILQKFFVNDKGLKCAVIYTKEDISDVIEELKAQYIVLDEKNCLFQVGGDNISPLFGIVVKKSVSPDHIIGYITRILHEGEPITIEHMRNVNSNKAKIKYNVC